MTNSEVAFEYYGYKAQKCKYHNYTNPCDNVKVDLSVLKIIFR